MITKKLWEEFKEIELVKEESIFSFKYTPSQLAVDFIARIFVTPFTILFDLILLPLEISYYIVKRHYERELENE